MTITAKNIGRINVWPTYDAAREVDTEESEFVGRLTVYRTNAEARANLTSEGGGGGLDWVPEGAVIHIDLVRAFNDEDAAWTEEDGIVAVDTLLGVDANTENGWDATEYDPDLHVADGYDTDQASQFALIGAARSKVLAGCTFRVKTKRTTDNVITSSPFVVVSTDGNDAIEVDLNGSELVEAYSWNGSLFVSMPDIVNSGATGQVNCAAITITDSRFDIAVNGSEPVDNVITSEDRPEENPFTAVVVDANTNGPGTFGNVIQSITLYDALPSTAGLSELSEVA